MKENMVMVRNAMEQQIVIEAPEYNLRRVWTKCGAQFPIDRDILEQVYYRPGVEYLFTHGMLVTDDKQFLYDVGLITDMEEEREVIVLDDKLKKRIIGAMPMREVEEYFNKFSPEQIEEVVNYAIRNYKDLNNSKIEFFGEKGHKDMLRAIKNYQDSIAPLPETPSKERK